MKYNIDKVICINFTSHNEHHLKSISEVYKIGYDALLNTKSRGTKKIWIEIGGDYAIAAVETKNDDDFYICEKYCPLTKKEIKQIKSIKPIKTPKLPKT